MYQPERFGRRHGCVTHARALPGTRHCLCEHACRAVEQGTRLEHDGRFGETSLRDGDRDYQCGRMKICMRRPKVLKFGNLVAAGALFMKSGDPVRSCAHLRKRMQRAARARASRTVARRPPPGALQAYRQTTESHFSPIRRAGHKVACRPSVWLSRNQPHAGSALLPLRIYPQRLMASSAPRSAHLPEASS